MTACGHNRLAALMHELETAFVRVAEQDGAFYQMRTAARDIAPAYPEFIVWSPELRGSEAVSDIWDRSWNRLAEVQVEATERMINAPMW